MQSKTDYLNFLVNIHEMELPIYYKPNELNSDPKILSSTSVIVEGGLKLKKRETQELLKQIKICQDTHLYQKADLPQTTTDLFLNFNSHFNLEEQKSAINATITSKQKERIFK